MSGPDVAQTSARNYEQLTGMMAVGIPKPSTPGVGGATDELLGAISALHAALLDLEMVLENAGLLRPAPPTPMGGASNGGGAVQRISLSEQIRSASNSVFAARDRVNVLRERVDL
jgi:hypothetical protein